MIFLLGSGASHPEMPSTHDITLQVLSGEGVARHTNSLYFFGSPLCGRDDDEDINRIVRLMNLVRSICETYYSDEPTRGTNYEDYYYVLSQISDSELREFDNPAVQPLIDELRLHVEQIVSPPHSFATIRRVEDIFRESTNYIEDVSMNMLRRQRPNLDDHLQYLIEAIAARPRIDIFTLNHDTVIEDTLTHNGIAFIDGFGGAISDLRYWQPELFSSNEQTTRLFKIHGSIDWYWVQPGDGEPGGLAQFRDQNIHHLPRPDAQELIANPPRPRMLMGTFNKMLYYTQGLYTELHCNFHVSLGRETEMVVCGYGFRDKGINTKIAQWLTANRERRMTVIHHNPISLFARARGLIANNAQMWQDSGQLQVIEVSAQEVTWQDIRNTFP